MHILMFVLGWLVLTAVGTALVALLLWRIQFTFFPFNRRREEALRMRLLRDKIASRRTWRGDLERRLTLVERALAEMDQRRAAWAMGSPGGSCLKEGKTVAIPPTLAETERAFNIAQTPSSLRPPSPPSSPAIETLADCPSTRRT